MALVLMPSDAVFVRTQWVPPAQNQINTSGWTGARQVLRAPGVGRWRVSAALKPIAREIDVFAWRAFCTAVEGQANTFLMPYCKNQYRAPGMGSNPVVKTGQGDLSGNETMVIAGLGAAGTKMYAGQVITVTLPSGKKQMLMLKAHLIAASNGEATATFRAALRESPAGNSAVETLNPVAEMAMTDDAVPIPQDNGVYNLAFEAAEVW